MYYPPETRVSFRTVIHRERMLPVPGEVVVQPGQRVEPWDVVAQAAVPGGYRIVEIAQALKVRSQDVAQCLLKKDGDEVEAGVPLAARRGLLRRVVRSPVSGVIVAVGAGRLLIEAETATVEVRAGMRGRVEQVRRNWGVAIETVGAVAQGVWGNGREGHGVLKVLSDSPQGILTRENLEVGSQGAVILAGQGMTLEALEFAAEVQVRGVVVGSLEAGLLSAVQAAPFPVIVSEGWGSIPMSTAIFEVLQANDGREVSLHGHLEVGWASRRPEVIVPMVAGETAPETPSLDLPLALGATVRILRAPFMGATGSVVAMPDLPRRLPAGLALRGAEVLLANGEQVFVPFANLERIH